MDARYQRSPSATSVDATAGAETARAEERSDALEATPESGWRYTFSSLYNRDFFFLWLSMLTMMAGIQMQMIARSYLTYEITSSPFILGLVNAGFAFPILGLSLFGGAMADRIERKYIIQAGQGVAAILAVLVGIAIYLDVIVWYHLFLASILQGALFAFLMPARQAIIPQLVGQDKVSNAIALNSAAMSSMTLVAPAIAGWAYAYLGPYNLYFGVAALALLSFVLTGMIPKTGTSAGRRPAPMMKDIIAGLAYIKHSPLVLVLLLMGLATALLAMPFRFMMPIFVVDVYRMGPDALGLLVTIMGGGSLVGSLFIASIGNKRRGLLLILGSFISGIALLLIAAVPKYLFAAVVMVLLGLGDAGRRTLNQALIMEKVEDQYRGRVMSVFMLNFGLMPLGVLPAGIIAEYMGGQVAVGLLAVLLLIVTAIIYVTQKELRNTQ